MKKLILSVMIWGAVLSLGAAVDKVKVITTYVDKRPAEEKVMELQKQPDGAMRLYIPIRDIAKGTDVIEIRPDFAKAKKGEDGYAIFTPNQACSYTQENGRVEQRRMALGVTGMKTERDTFAAIHKGLRYEYSTVLEAKDGKYEMYYRFLINEMYFDPYEDIIIDFYPLHGEEANYVGMAKVYRKYQLDRGEVKPLRERIKGNPALKYAAETVFVRIKHGGKPRVKEIEHQTPENEPEVKVYNTFDDFMDIMRKMKAAGVEEASMCFVGWNSGGFDGRFPDIFPVEEKFGGEKKMREAIELGKSFGYRMNNHVCNTDFYRIAKRFNEDDIAKTPDGKLRPYAHMAGGRAYNPCFQRVCDRIVDDDYKGLKDLGMNGIQHVDVTSAISPYPCHDPRHPINRKQCAEYQIKIGEKARKYFGGFSSEAGYDHVAPILDYALYTSTFYWRKDNEEKGRWKKLKGHNMWDQKIIPFWQVIYHGIILSQPDWQTIDYTMYPKGHERRLKFIEFGGRPTFYWMNYKKVGVAPIKEAYDEYQPMKYLQYEYMDDHREISKDVFLTVYSDGSEVVTNYSQSDYAYKGETVPSRDYKLFKAEKKSEKSEDKKEEKKSFFRRIFG